jgi:hypothetical protein
MKFKKIDILEKFAKRIPNAEKIIVDYRNDKFWVHFDQVHANEYKISTVLDAFKALAEKQSGQEVIFI